MRFDPRRRVYVDERGRVMSQSQVRRQVENYVADEEKLTEREAAKMVAGTITATSFFLFMQNKVEAWHKVAGAIAYGGRAQMDAERWERVAQIVQREQTFLISFIDDVAKASVLTEGVVNRAGMYPNAAYSTYENQVLERESDAGVTLGRRICESDGASCDECVSAATEEFIPLDEIEDIGSLACLNNCRCEIEFSVDGTEFRTSDVFSGVITGQGAYGGSEILS